MAGGKRWWLLSGVMVGLVVFAVGIFLWRAGLEDADRWSSVFGFFLNVAGLALTVSSVVLARKENGGGTTSNRILKGTFAGPVLMARDVAPGPSATGEVSNEIRDGHFENSTTMARDVRAAVPPANPGDGE